MSLLKNNDSFTDLSYTIKTLSAIPVGNVNYDILQYTRLTKAAFKILYPIEAQGTILIRAIIPTDVNISDGAYGYFFGMKYPSGQTQYNQWIGVKNISGTKKVVWGCGNTEIIGPALDGKSHDYGFVGGYAVMDNKKVSESQSTPVPAGWTQGCVGGMYNGSYAAILYFPDIYIQRFDLLMFASTSPEEWNTPYLCRFYPTGSGLVRNAMRMVESFLTADIASGGSTAAGPALEKPYGIQLDDLKYLSGSGYKNLIPLVCCDGGEDERMHPQSPEGAYTGITGHYFAFDLSGTKIPGGRTPDPALPYQRGKLSAGRKPLGWDIWNDCIDRGFYVRNDNGTYKLEFNIFKKSNGLDDDEVHLDMFEGYNTDPSCVHLPKVEFYDDIATIEYHNGLPYKCSEDSVVIGVYSGDTDDRYIFKVDRELDFNFRSWLGNTIPWNVTKAQMQANPDNLYYVFGGGARLTLDGDEIGSSVKNEGVYMCADNPSDESVRAALKQKYSVDGVEGNIESNYLVTALRNKLLAAAGNTLSGQIEIALIGSANGNVVITMPDFYEPQDISVHGTFNQKLNDNTSVNMRQFLNESIGSLNLAYKRLPNGSMFFDTVGDVNPNIIAITTRECNAEATAVLNTTHTTYAFVTVMAASESNPNQMSAMYIGIAQSVGNLIGTATTEGTKNKSIQELQSAQLYFGDGWWRGATSMDGDLSYIQTAAVDASEMCKIDDARTHPALNFAAIQYANVRIDIMDYTKIPIMSLMRGTFYGESNTIGMPYSVSGTTSVNIFTRNAYYTDNTGQSTIIEIVGQKWSKTGSAAWVHVNENESVAPTFNKTIKLRKGSFGSFPSSGDVVATFSYASGSFTKQSNSLYTRDNVVSGKYTCIMEYRLIDTSYTTPNGTAETEQNWYYVIRISFTGSGGTSDTDYPKAGDTYEVLFE